MSDAPIEIRLRGPGGEPVDLWRTLVSHGFHDLAPASIDVYTPPLFKPWKAIASSSALSGFESIE